MKRVLSAVLVLLLLLCPTVRAEEKTADSESATVLMALKSYILRNYQFEVDEDDLLDAIIEAVLAKQDDGESFEFLADAMMSALDQHSVYFTPEEQKEFEEYVDAEFGGVGVSLVMIEGYCTIMSILDGTPAQKTTNLKVGDKIIKVDGTDVVGMDIDLIINRTRGPVGEQVVLTVLSDDGSVWECPVVRDIIVTPSVEYVVNKAGDAAYVVISQFGLDTAQQFKDCHAEIKAKGINKIIIDVRDNTGGYTQRRYFCPKVRWFSRNICALTLCVCPINPKIRFPIPKPRLCFWSMKTPPRHPKSSQVRLRITKEQRLSV